MCGIAGAFGHKILSSRRVQRTLSLMKMRGPDGSGHYSSSCADYSIDLLHTRLSIVDLNIRSNQPLISDDLILSFNGEIYNYIELRDQLKSKGHKFKTSGDGEVIIAAYRQWGDNCVKYFEGMWAFAIYDNVKHKLFLSRDRFGEKPLYYCYDDGVFYFASEVKFLFTMRGRKSDINYQQLQRYLVNGYKSLYFKGDTFFNDIFELPAACNATLNCPNIPNAKKYWHIGYNPRPMSLDDALEGAKERIFNAIGNKLRADVLVALRLSGGIDSNVALGVAINHFGRDITTFSIIDDDPRYDETAAILKSIKYHGCKHNLINIPKDGFMDRLSGMIDYFGAPIMSVSFYLQSLVSQKINEKGFKVSLGGTGADEIFTGYYDHYLFWLAEMKDRPDFDKLLAGWHDSYGKFVRNPFLQDPQAFIKNPAARDHIFLRNDEFSQYLCDDFNEQHAEKKYCDAILRNRMLNELFNENVPVLLHEDDLCSMAYSVENRAIYLDTQLAEFLFSVPSEHLIHDKLPKYLLRQAGNGLVDDSILTNPQKQGMNAPITNFVDFNDEDFRDEILSNGPLYDMVNKDMLDDLISSDIKLNSESKFLFSIISTKLFLQNHANFVP